MTLEERHYSVEDIARMGAVLFRANLDDPETQPLDPDPPEPQTPAPDVYPTPPTEPTEEPKE